MEMQLKPPPELIVKNLLSASREGMEELNLKRKGEYLRAACLADISLPVMTIGIRDSVEAEIKARHQADLNRLAMEHRIASQVSPEHLDDD